MLELLKIPEKKIIISTYIIVTCWHFIHYSL